MWYIFHLARPILTYSFYPNINSVPVCCEFHCSESPALASQILLNFFFLKMRPVATDVACSVCILVTTVSPAEMAALIEMPVGV